MYIYKTNLSTCLLLDRVAQNVCILCNYVHTSSSSRTCLLCPEEPSSRSNVCFFQFNGDVIEGCDVRFEIVRQR